jgi:hypothetical protein
MSINSQSENGTGKWEYLVAQYMRDNAFLIIFASLVASAAFGYELFNFTLSIDEEIKSFDSGGLEWIRQGRWGTYLLLRLFMPESLIPFFPTLVSLFFLICGSFILFFIIDGDKISKMIFLLLFLTFPSTAFFLEFNTFNFAVSAGLASVLLGFYFFTRFTGANGYGNLLISVILTTLSFGTYQTMLTVWICSFFIFLLYKSLYDGAPDKIVREFAAAAAVLSLSLILYKLIALLFMGLYKLKGSQYLDNFVGWTAGGYAATAGEIGRYLGSHLTGKSFYGEKTLLWIWLAVPYLIYRLFRKKGTGRQIRGILSIAALILSPFAVSVALGSALPVRSLVALPLMVGGLGYLASLKAGRKMKYFFLAISFFIALHNTFSITRLFYADHLTSQADRDLANRILDRIYELDINYEEKGPVPVAILGARGYSSNEAFIKDEVFGASFFEWEGGNPYRILYFLKLLGVEDFKVADARQYKAAVEESAKMQKWPHKSSIVYTGDVIVVKLSDITGPQWAQLRKHVY